MPPDLLAACRRALLRYSRQVGDAATAGLTPVSGGFSGALVVRVETDRGDWCLRRWPEGSLPVARLRELHRWLTYLQGEAALPLAVPALADDSDSLSDVGGAHWQVEPWLPGRADFHVAPSDDRLREAMHVLALLHRASAGYVCSDSGRAWFNAGTGASPAVHERLHLLTSLSPPRVQTELAGRLAAGPAGDLRDTALEILSRFRGIAPAVEEALRGARGLVVPLFPCLRDVWRDHVLFEGHRVSGVIDPAATRTETVASDLSRLLGSLLADDFPRWRAALAMYAEVRPLSPEEHRLVGVLDASGVLLSGMTWVRRIAAGQVTGEIDRIRARMSSILARLKSLAARIPSGPRRFLMTDSES